MKYLSLVVISLILLPGFAMAHGNVNESFSGEHHEGMMDGYYGHGIWGIGIIHVGFMFLILIGLILFIIWLLKQLQNPKTSNRKKYNGK